MIYKYVQNIKMAHLVHSSGDYFVLSFEEIF